MERTSKPTRGPWRLGRALGVSAALAALLVVAGCGTAPEYANKKRPPSPITITAYIRSGQVFVSPRHIGGGPVLLVATNQTHRAQRLTLRAKGGGGLSQHAGPINPDETATIQAFVRHGRYLVGTSHDRVQPATLVVGKRRKSAQNQLLLP